MKLSIMQPYFCAYIGYYQLIKNADKFVVYDNIEYTKKGWINRNRILVNSEARIFSIPLKNESDYLNIKDRYISSSSSKTILKTLGQIQSNYSKAPLYNDVFPIIKEIFLYDSKNLFDYVFNSILTICDYLKIDTEIIVSSSLNIDHSKKSKDKVIDICKYLNASNYINSIGGKSIYHHADFNRNEIKLQFLQTLDFEYKQYENSFIPNLSIIDVLMFNSISDTKHLLENFNIIE